MFDNIYNFSKCDNLVVVTRTKTFYVKKKTKLNVIFSNFFLLNGLDNS